MFSTKFYGFGNSQAKDSTLKGRVASRKTLPLLQCEEEFLVLNRISLDWLRDQAALWQFGEFEMMLTRNQPTHVKYLIIM